VRDPGFYTGATLLACLQLGCIILFIIPPTAVLGAVGLTGYLGGAIARYTCIGEPYPVLALSTRPITWLGIWLRDGPVMPSWPGNENGYAFP